MKSCLSMTGWRWFAGAFQVLAASTMQAQIVTQNQVKSDALVLLKTQSVAEMHASITGLEKLGVYVLHVFPPRALICSLPVEIEPVVLADPAVQACHRAALEPPDAGAPLADALDGINAWNRFIAPTSLAAPALGVQGDSLAGDAFVPPDRGVIGRFVPASEIGSEAPTADQTSEYMIGKVAVGIILPESNGSGENWSSSRQDTVIREITAGCNWWATRGGTNAHLTFYYDIHRNVPTQYEPIQRPYYDEALWIPETLRTLGYTGSGRFEICRNYDNAIRSQFHSDWAFTIFVVDSLNDSDGKFSDGLFAYAYIGGPFLVMTYDNDGYGIDNMNIVLSHEMGHIFGALDEYSSSYCACDETSGYLDVANGNCATCTSGDSTCIMRGGIRNGLCTYSKGQIGWRDSDGDGIFDPADTSVSVTLSASSPGSTYTFTGTATDVAYPSPSPTHLSTSINIITNVEYRLDSGAWSPATPSDGAFNSARESYGFTVTSVSPGSHTLEVRARNSAGNAASQLATVTGSVIYVDRAYGGASPNGSLSAPFKTVTAGYQLARGGNTIRIFPGNYPETISFAKTLRIEATNGTVNIGR